MTGENKSEDAHRLREDAAARLFAMVPNFSEWMHNKTLDPTITLAMLCILKLLDRGEFYSRELALCFELIEHRLNGHLSRVGGNHVTHHIWQDDPTTRKSD